jgi:hypothetical protein
LHFVGKAITFIKSAGSFSKQMLLMRLEIVDLYSSPNIVRQIRSRRIRGAGLVARMGWERKIVRGFGGKGRRKETTWKAET